MEFPLFYGGYISLYDLAVASLKKNIKKSNIFILKLLLARPH